jgi:hypothetical protein
MIITEKTITSIFFMPTLKIEREELFNNAFINAYLGDVDKEEYHSENVIFLLFKPDNLEEFRKFVNKQYDINKDLVEDYDYEGGYVILVYNLNPVLEKDFKLVKLGKYSKTSLEFKNLFPKQIRLLNRPNQPLTKSLQWMIFEKDQKLIDFIESKIDEDISSKDLEVWPIFNELLEILDINNIKNNNNDNNTRT